MFVIMRHTIYPFLILVYTVLLSSTKTLGQKNSLEINSKAGTYLSTNGKIPLLNGINNYGLVPLGSNTVYLNSSFEKNYDSLHTFKDKLNSWGFSYGLEAQLNLSSETKLLLPVIHLSGRYKSLELYVGRKREFFGLADTTGTFGSYIWSRNALPMPKVQIHTPNYLRITKNGFLSTKFGIAHGWFGDQSYTEGYYLHQKWFYLKFGKETNTLSFTAGINHLAQWGGYSETLKDDQKATVDGYFPDDWFTYLNVFLPIKSWKVPLGKNYPYWESGNRFGNHFGSVDLGLDFSLPFGKLSLYRQSPWEDGQGVEVFFSSDGNYTLMLKPESNKLLQKISFELLSTQKQGLEISKFAKALGLTERHPSEVQNYLNHGQYLDGWSYNDFGIGTPAIIPHNDLEEDAKASSYNRFTQDNMVTSLGFSAEGKFRKVSYVIHLGNIRSKGLIRNQRPETLNQFTSQVSCSVPITSKGILVQADLGFDYGKLYGNQTGVNLSLIKNWN